MTTVQPSRRPHEPTIRRPTHWDDWVEWDAKAWPRKGWRGATCLVPTVCFNCESACGLMAYVDKETL